MKLRFGYSIEVDKTPDLAILINQAVLAEKNGFEAIWAGDHFHPWLHTGAGSPQIWVWLAAVAERTKKVNLGTGVTAPILRYHPALVAQTFATLGVMYPDRIFLTVATGEAMNEVPLGYPWPPHKERAERLEEAIRIIRALWTRDFVNFKGKYFDLNKANLYTKPKKSIPLYVAASGAKVAELAGKYGDGFLTGDPDLDFCRKVLFPAVEKGAKAAGRQTDDVIKMVSLSAAYDPDLDRALESSLRWAVTSLPAFYKYPIYDPREIESYVRWISKEQIAKAWPLVGTSAEDHIKGIEKFIKAGFTDIQVCDFSPSEEEFMKLYGERVLPYLRETYGKD